MAWQLNKLDKMVTLHLNEQSDAKLLIGMYATGAKPGTFSWRPGVLTTAVREGRWIFVEDLDRAPNEVISILLPLIERGEMLIPSRGETVRAAEGFRIIATMTTTLNPKGQEIVPRQNMIGHRLWSAISIQMPHLLELRQIISAKYSVLQQHLSGILGVYSRLLNLYSDARFLSENGLSIRAITPRDLFKWCDRIATLLARSPTFSVAQKDDVFMEALECFAGSIQNEMLRLKIMSCVAEELHIDPQRRDFLLTSRTVQLKLPAKDTASGVIQIGRAKLPRHKSSRLTTSRRPFSTNDSTLRLLESISVAVDRREPLLLVGETGTGKTTCIQYLAEQLGRKLVVFNLSQQSESGDLLGGFKPVNVRSLVIPLKDEFDEIFDTTFSRKKNSRFLEMLGKRVARGEWNRVCTLWREALKMVDGARKARESMVSTPDGKDSQPKKKRKTESLPATFPAARWEKFAADLHDLEAQLSSGSEAFAFSFLEGNIVKAVRNGDWILLDEINLASSDTLEALTDLFSGGSDGNPSILLTETGNVERLVAHPNFRVFAAMNPATDVGKKDLPPGVRSRFTELYVESPDSNEKSLCNIVEKYLASGNGNVDSAVLRISRDVTKLYLEIQRLAKANMLVDGADQKPHFSLRTLTRTLSYAREVAPLCSLRRALYEGFHMSFLTFLAKSSEDLVTPLITKHLFPEKAILKAELGKPLQHPADTRHYVRQGHYWLRQGLHAVEEQLHYIITPFVQRNMNNLMRAASTRKYPVLIQGPTSSGKTSMIEYLAKRSGNKFVRINNHEHTDLQEYLGSYISGVDGKLSFQEGILVRALREGHWIVLDELNLAPTDVLEALNRLLDDNRELLIPETQEVVRPHEDFMLFATQNPAGLYGGRKVLSRAFRNRFLELHFDDIPVEELTEILHRRTMIPETWCKRIVKVYRELSILRQENRIFEQKSFATLRDLFRWAQRKADTIQDLANNGYMLLAERVRKEEERLAIKRIVETVMSERGPKVAINEEELFNTSNWLSSVELSNGDTSASAGVVWTRAMRRLFVLVAHALRNNEPVLLVGETGCGKTTVCQLLADHFQNQLHIVNAHQNTETGDLIGAQRPIRNRTAIEESLREQILEILRTFQDQDETSSLSTNHLLEQYDKLQQGIPEISSGPAGQLLERTRIQATALFEWADGSLVQAMKEGHYFLLDEISLADDSVLERLNSVLESSRTLFLAEKGPNDSLVTATEGFQFLATMNPGGDYGKKELSPALRNRFTEIWVPPMTDVEDILQIIQSKLKPNMIQYADGIIAFSQWFNDKYNTSVTSSISIRDTLSWVSFISKTEHHIPVFGIVHGAAMVFIDTLGANPAGLLAISASSINDERRGCLRHLSELVGQDVEPIYFGEITILSTDQMFQLGEFAVPKFDSTSISGDSSFFLDAPTTRVNAMRVFRALQLDKPILLEGNPGVGKSTLVTALAKLVGKNLVRLNLSEQTDLMDLFGSDVPVEGGAAGTFAWRDAPFLQAMKNGDWVLLDEMNLASQSILEGLNAVLDHRGEVYISELDQKFHKHGNFRVFAAQNPHHQGGGRKGLPASFVNRFTVVYADVFSSDDLEIICQKIFPCIEGQEITKLIRFVAELDEQVTSRRAFGNLGAPWEFNLRDTLRWLQLLASSKYPGSARDFLDTIFVQRMRTENDRNQLQNLFSQLYGSHEPRITHYHSISTQLLQVGLGVLPRDNAITRPDTVSSPSINQLAPLEAMLVSVQQNWPMIIVGSSGSGKTTLINKLASFVGARLITFSMNPDIDAMDLVGGYEQVDPLRALHQCREKLEDISRRRVASMTEPLEAYVEFLERLQSSTTEVLDILDPMLELVERSDREIFILLQDFQRLSQSSSHQIDGARFQWVDGILVRALEQGDWLVLDNANLCSSAVLDRLNALLEPNGYLSINEHSMANGEAQIVQPHPGFRIFMTVDPRYGELSRAMRNRAVEICLLPSADDHIQSHEPVVQYPLDSTMYRFRQFQENSRRAISTIQQDFENLGPSDMKLLKSFEKQLQGGLASFKTSTYTNGTITQSNEQLNDITPIPQDAKINHLDFANFLSNEWASHMHNPHHQADTTDLVQLATCHPLGNELLLHQNQNLEGLGIWKSSMYDIMLDLHEMRSAVHNLPSAKFERLKEKQKLPSFLHEYVQVFSHFVQAVWTAHHESEQIDVAFLKPLRILFWEVLSFATGSTFDRAALRTYLNMLTSAVATTISNAGTIEQHFKDALSKKIAVFGSNIQLTTGLGMERMWRTFKPVTPTTHHQFRALIELENTADRLDAIMWKSDLALDDMVQIRERMIASLDLLRKDKADATELLLSLGSAVDEFEKSVGQPTSATNPYFEEEFEGFCQFLDIAAIDSKMKHSIDSDAMVAVRARSVLLARRPTKLKAIDSDFKADSSALFSKLTRYLGLTSRLETLCVAQNLYHTGLVAKLYQSHEVQLVQLDCFEKELQVLSQGLSLDASVIMQDQCEKLGEMYQQIYHQLCSSHGDIIHSLDQGNITFEGETHITEAYRLTLQQGFASSYRSAGTIDAKAWVELGLFGLCLYVSNYPFDPALSPMLERQMFIKTRHSMLNTLDLLRQFQIGFTGQETSFRIRLIEEAIQYLGDEPPVPAIIRPEISQLEDLQGEFSNLLSVINPILHGTMSIEDAYHDATLKSNVLRIIQRLTENYREYDDITDTVVGFLLCLSIGLVLGRKEADNKEPCAASTSLKYISSITPFFGREKSIETADCVFQELEHGLVQHGRPMDSRQYAVHSLSVLKKVDPVSMTSYAARSLLHSLFSSFYSDWKTKLLQDQEKQAQNSSLYTYKGMEDDTAEEDRDLFPDYEADQEEKPSSSVQESHALDHVIKIATIHAELFVQEPGGSDPIQALLSWCTREMNRLRLDRGSSISYDDAMPAIFLVLNQKIDALTTSVDGPTYNFYFDANLAEAKTMMKLIHRIQNRYRQIRNIWPEHATLSEVLRTCDEALEFRHVDPVAKFITKAEKLHEYMHEWQKVASKEYSTADLYDDLTKLLISWRQLELTTWAKLFDMEVDKCHKDAQSWFFIAYELIIAASESVEEGIDLTIHATKLVQSLEVFFESTTIGQFEQRVKLLRQLCQHAAMRMQDVQVFKTIYAALNNFVAYISRFEQPVREALAKGRQSLEREVKDVIKLASWKDTNIDALKQSAKTSHRKLSKLVRKFRALLNQSISKMLQSEIPNTGHIKLDVVFSTIDTTVDTKVLEFCENGVPAWSAQPSRFKNLSATVSLMRSLSTPRSDTIDGALRIDEFVRELSSSIIELQKATPSTLTDDNKKAVQHLKIQKRKLYADTMKELRHMGIASNLSMDLLVRQDSLSTILSTLPPLSQDVEAGRSAASNLHNVLNIMPRVRAVYKEHSGDLTPNDVAKSIGYLEGLLHRCLRQRAVLNRAVQSFEIIRSPVMLLSSLCQCAGDELSWITREQHDSTKTLQPKIRWLTTMLKTGTDIICAQAKMGKTNQLAALKREMREWTMKLQSLADSFDRLPKLPINIQSSSHRTWNESVQTTFSQFRSTFEEWVDKNEMSSTVLRQIKPFLFEYPQVAIDTSSNKMDVSIDIHTKSILESLDLILGSMQDVSTALKDLPASADDIAWLVKEEGALSNALNRVHSSQISHALQTILENFRQTSSIDVQIVAAFLVSKRPILGQYVVSYKYLIDRFDAIHASTTGLLLQLSKSFIQIGTQGFCQPPEKSSDQEKGKDEKLESGTGLGEGEGAEDISKDIDDQDDLEDLAQEKGGEREGSIEEEDDAVDMGEQDLEGETGERAEKEDKGDESGEEGDDDVQSEVGSVDDLGPSAVDEKMWDEEGEDEDDAKDREGKGDIGTEDQNKKLPLSRKRKKRKEIRRIRKVYKKRKRWKWKEKTKKRMLALASENSWTHILKKRRHLIFQKISIWTIRTMKAKSRMTSGIWIWTMMFQRKNWIRIPNRICQKITMRNQELSRMQTKRKKLLATLKLMTKQMRIKMMVQKMQWMSKQYLFQTTMPPIKSNMT